MPQEYLVKLNDQFEKHRIGEVNSPLGLTIVTFFYATRNIPRIPVKGIVNILIWQFLIQNVQFVIMPLFVINVFEVERISRAKLVSGGLT